MPIPAPEPDLIISDAYVWDREAQSGQQEGRKDRPCVIALALERLADGEMLVTVLPVTHRPPDGAAAGIEIPRAVKQHLGLDDARSWIIVSEGDQVVWPGSDLREVPGADRYEYGFRPPRLFARILAAFGTWRRANTARITSRG